MTRMLIEHPRLKIAIVLGLLSLILYLLVIMGCYERGPSTLKLVLLPTVLGLLAIITLILWKARKRDKPRTPIPWHVFLTAIPIVSPTIPAFHCMAHTGSELAHAAYITFYLIASCIAVGLLLTKLEKRKKQLA